MSSVAGVVECLSCLGSSRGLGVSQHVDGNPGFDRGMCADTINGFLHHPVTTIAACCSPGLLASRPAAPHVRLLCGQFFPHLGNGMKDRLEQHLEHVKLANLMRRAVKNLANGLGIQGRTVGSDARRPKRRCSNMPRKRRKKAAMHPEKLSRAQSR